jgi:hypothetical protein
MEAESEAERCQIEFISKSLIESQADWFEWADVERDAEGITVIANKRISHKKGE